MYIGSSLKHRFQSGIFNMMLRRLQPPPPLLASAGKNPGFKVGGSWRFQRQEIANWIKRKVEAQPGGSGGA